MLALSPQALLHLASQASMTAAAFAASPTPQTLETLRGPLEDYAASGLRSRMAPELLRRRDATAIRLRRNEIYGELVGLEGEARAHLTAGGALPEVEAERLKRVITDGHCDVSRIAAGVGNANRHLHKNFLSCFLWTLEGKSTRGRRYLKPTYLKPYPQLQSRWRSPCLLKPEYAQEGGSYAIRGVINLLLHRIWDEGPAIRERTLAIALRASTIESIIRGARLLGFKDVEVYLTQQTPPTVLTELRALSVRIKVVRVPPSELDDVTRLAAKEDPRLFYVPSSHPLLAMGYGTIGAEIASSLNDRASDGFSVVVPSADAALLSGLAAYFAKTAPVFHLDSAVTDTGTVPLRAGSSRGETCVVVLPDRRIQSREVAERILSRT